MTPEARAVVRGLLAAAVLGAAAGALGAAARPEPPTAEGPVWRMRRGSLLYRFHATFDREALFDAVADPLETRDVAAERPSELAILRAEFLRRMRAGKLEEVPDSAGAWRQRVEGVGYLGGGGEPR